MSLTIIYLWDADYPWDVRTEKICAALTAGGHDVHILARNKKRSSVTESLPEATVHRMSPLSLAGPTFDRILGFPAFFNPRWIRLVGRATRELRPDVIIVRDLPLCPLAIAVGRWYGVPVILDMAENYAAMMQEIWDAGRQRPFDFVIRNPRAVSSVEAYCLRRIETVITVVEESSERLIAAGLPAHRTAVVSNTPSRQRVVAAQPRDYDTAAPLRIVYLGLMEIPRGIEQLIAAVGLMHRGGHDVLLSLIGAGRDERIFHEQVADSSLSSVVEFHGYVPNKRALELVAAADVGVVPHHANDSWNSTIPNKLFDYMAVGLPVVSSDAIPAARVVRETGAGEVFRSGDASDLARALRIFADPVKRRAAGEAGRAAVLDSYNWEASVAVLLQVVTDVASRGWTR
jgi:glycosyltransferase involved in cell wall biosynthesis